MWHSAELSETERDLLADATIDSIIRQLKRRFQERPEVALVSLNRERYTLSDLRAGKSIRAFTARVLRLSRAIGQDSTYQTLLNV